MTIFFYKGLTRNPEIGNTLIWVLPNTWRLGRIMDTKIGTILSDRILLNAAKIQGYSFYRFWVIKGKPTVGAGKTTPPPLPRLGLKAMLNSIDLYKGIFLHAIPVRIIVPCLTWILISQEKYGKTQNISKLSVS